MLLEGNTLIALLVGVSIVIAVIVVAIRFAVKKDAPASGGLLSRLGRGQAAAEEAEEGAEAGEAGAALEAGDGLELPSLEELDPLAAGPENKAPQPAAKAKGAGGASVGEVVKDLLGGLLGKRKKPEEVKHEVREIDDQLNQVLQESQNMGLDIPTAIKVPDIGTFSESNKNREIDNSIRNQLLAPERKPEAQSQPQSLEGLNPYSAQNGIGLNPPEIPAMAPPEPNKPQEQARPDLSRQPNTPKPPDSQAPENVFKGGGALDSANDLLSEIAADTVKEEKIDLSIMKNLEHVPIACNELETELTDILGQINRNVERGGKKKRAEKPGAPGAGAP